MIEAHFNGSPARANGPVEGDGRLRVSMTWSALARLEGLYSVGLENLYCAPDPLVELPGFAWVRRPIRSCCVRNQTASRLPHRTSHDPHDIDQL